MNKRELLRRLSRARNRLKAIAEEGANFLPTDPGATIPIPQSSRGAYDSIEAGNEILAIDEVIKRLKLRH